MKRPSVATVVTARPWEPAFVEVAASSARVRLVARIAEAAELARLIDRFDVLLVGAETPWWEPWIPGALDRLGHRSIGLHQEGDLVGARLVMATSLRYTEATPPEVLVAGAVSLGQSRAPLMDRSTVEPHTQRYSRAPGSTGRYR